MPNDHQDNKQSRFVDTGTRQGEVGRVHTYGMGKGAGRPTGRPAPQNGAPHETHGVEASGLSPQSQPHLQQNERRKKPASFWIAIAVAIACVVLACILGLSMCNSGKSSRQGDPGQLEGKTQEEIQAELDRTVEEGMFNISIASVVQFENGTSEGELRIENVPANYYLMKVVITLDDTGQQIYETDLIEPNHHIQRDTLDVDLEPGTYAATATFMAYDPETEEEIGQAAAKVTIVVLG